MAREYSRMHYHYFTIEQRNALSDLIHSRVTEPGMPDALQRLHTPDFGVCDTCGTDIPFIRLMGNPQLRRCSGCAAKL